MSEEPKKEFKQEYLEEKLHAISEKLGDAYGEPFLRELISRMERTVAHFNEEVDVMVSTVKNNSKKRRKFLAEKRGLEFPLVIAGGNCSLNPEPVADFFDLFVVFQDFFRRDF